MLKLQPMQSVMGPFIEADGYGEMLAKAGPAYTGIHGLDVVICAGVYLDIPQRGIAWALLSEKACAHMVSCTRAVARFLAEYKVRRIQTYVETSFAQGHRWAGVLGFAREGTLKAWGPNGEDYDIYARVQP